MIFLFHFLALLLFVVTQENRKVSMRSKLWWCEVQKSGIFGLFTGWIFFSLSSQGGAFVSQSNLDLSNLISFFLFRRFLIIFGIFFYISSGSDGQAGGFWCVCGIAQWGEIISKKAILVFFFTCIFTRYLWNIYLKFVLKFEKYLV